MGDGLMVMCACTCFESKAAPLGFSLGVWSVWFIIKMACYWVNMLLGMRKKMALHIDKELRISNLVDEEKA